ncbi:MAG: hypothetical protein JXA57_14220, partial [Armatimonadetes bacterium]|nr:hypothetical protein [Armatimonadota bacterium]
MKPLLSRLAIPTLPIVGLAVALFLLSPREAAQRSIPFAKVTPESEAQVAVALSQPPERTLPAAATHCLLKPRATAPGAIQIVNAAARAERRRQRTR